MVEIEKNSYYMMKILLLLDNQYDDFFENYFITIYVREQSYKNDWLIIEINFVKYACLLD